jgi:hypothetical protein
MMTRARVGVLVPAGNPTVEPELYRCAPSVTIHFARLETVAGDPGAAEGWTAHARLPRLPARRDAFPSALRPTSSRCPHGVSAT